MLLKHVRKETINVFLITLLTFLSAAGIALYCDDTILFKSGSSFLAVLLLPIYWKIWTEFFMEKSDSKSLSLWGIFSLLFSACLVVGKILDESSRLNYISKVSTLYPGLSALVRISTIILLCFSTLPCIIIADRKLIYFKSTRSFNNGKLVKYGMIFISVSWLLIYLAAFPGIYANDAYTWYREFSDSTMPISSQWSPLCAWWFYFIVHSSYSLFGLYEPGMAIYSLLHLLFILWVVRQILLTMVEYDFSELCIISILFFALIPIHAIITIQTAQAVPFMGCFTMMLLYILRICFKRGNIGSINSRSMLIKLILWGAASCLFRNNARYAILVGIFLILAFYHSAYKMVLIKSMTVIVILSFVYSGPILSLFNIQKGTALREMLSLPLQQMCYVYLHDGDALTYQDKSEILEYLPEEAMDFYAMNQSISDHSKGLADIKRIKNDPAKFLRLYLTIGSKSPMGYFKGAYLQNLGLLYLDKSYPDPQMWHSYVQYTSTKLDDPKYIEIRRISLFPIYDKVLKLLFSSKGGYGGDQAQLFSDVPILSTLCRASTYFWFMIFAIFYAMKHKLNKSVPVLSLYFGFILTVFLSPVILCRYIEPAIFITPIVLLSMYLGQTQYDETTSS